LLAGYRLLAVLNIKFAMRRVEVDGEGGGGNRVVVVLH
jgi:hypothetical protein